MSALTVLCIAALKLTMRFDEIWKVLMSVIATLVLKDMEVSVKIIIIIPSLYIASMTES